VGGGLAPFASPPPPPLLWSLLCPLSRSSGRVKRWAWATGWDEGGVTLNAHAEISHDHDPPDYDMHWS
jgi:hypothetical protein